MDGRDQTTAQWLEYFDRHPTRNGYLLVAVYLFVNNSINATSAWMETTRDGSPDFPLWAPFVWEYSSAVAVLLLLPAVVYCWRRMPLHLGQAPRQLLHHILLSLCFSLLHVLLMVGMRELVYWLLGSNYEFNNWLREYFYEYRKDAWGYLLFYGGFQLYHVIARRQRGEAALIDAVSSEEAEPSPAAVIPEHLLVKKLDREFLVKVDDVEWLEAAGNYVNLHSHGRIYPLRATLADLSARLAGKGFSRIHRSLAVNHRAIDHISYLPSGDGEITLRNGKVLSLSRRYKDEFRQRL